MWKSKDLSILSVQKIESGNKMFCYHNLKRCDGTNIATCSKCSAVFLVNCKYN